MKFYFCETCGTRVTDHDLESGQARNKKLKGVYCEQCAVGVRTMETMPLTAAQARQILEQAAPPGPTLPHGAKPASQSGSARAASSSRRNSEASLRAEPRHAGTRAGFALPLGWAVGVGVLLSVGAGLAWQAAGPASKPPPGAPPAAPVKTAAKAESRPKPESVQPNRDDPVPETTPSGPPADDSTVKSSPSGPPFSLEGLPPDSLELPFKLSGKVWRVASDGSADARSGVQLLKEQKDKFQDGDVMEYLDSALYGENNMFYSTKGLNLLLRGAAGKRPTLYGTSHAMCTLNTRCLVLMNLTLGSSSAGTVSTFNRDTVVVFYNCLFKDSVLYFGREARFVNCVFSLGRLRWPDKWPAKVTLRNCIFYKCNGNLVPPQGDGLVLDSDYNCFRDENPALPALRALGQDAHSVEADPKFVLPVAYEKKMNLETPSDFRLKPNSPCKGKARGGRDLGLIFE